MPASCHAISSRRSLERPQVVPHVKFCRLSLKASVELDGYRFDDGFEHVDDWAPQRLVTATGPNPLPR